MFIEERYVVSSWSSILQAVHPAIQMSHRSVVYDFIIWVEVMKLETLESFLKTRTEHASYWTTALLLRHHLVIRAKHRPYMTL